MGKIITVEARVNAPIQKVWKFWTSPEHIVNWNAASDDWHTPSAENDLSVNGKFNYRMEARDGSMGFDFEGVYEKIEELRSIKYIMGDGRVATINFEAIKDQTNIVENFETEDENSIALQQQGWQAILNNFKKYT